MQHGLSTNTTVLQRWAQHNPELPLPGDWDEFKSKFPEQSIRMEIEDPELTSLLKNTASAKLRAEAISGDFSAVAPTQQEREEEARRIRVQEIFDQKPFGGDGRPANVSLCLELAKLNPALHQQLEEQHNAKGPTPDHVAMLRAQATADAERARQESMVKAMVMGQNAAARKRRFK